MATSRSTSFVTGFGAGLGIGAAAMFVLDPDRGRRRRALLRDEWDHLGRRSRSAVSKTRRDVRNRLQGAAHAVRGALAPGEASDRVVEQRIRAALGRIVGHPSAVGVRCRDGAVTLTGSLLAGEAEPLLRTARRTGGVRSVEDRLERRDAAAEDAAAPPPGPRPELLQERWNPATRLAAGGAGAGLLALGAARRGGFGALAAVAGAGLLSRSLGNRKLRQLARGRGRVDVRKAVTVAAPLDDVYRAWSRPTNFPLFMSHVERVEPLGGDTYHWIVRAPAGTRLGWDVRVSEPEPGRRLAWESVGDASVPSRGSVTFTPQGVDATRIEVRMSYQPPGGSLGHLVARAFGDDPKSALDDDLLRFKSLLEDGKTTARGRQVRVHELLH